MATVDLVVGIAAEYKGAPAFKKALTDTQKLTNSVKSLAKGYIGVLGAQKAFRYGQQSLKAFVQDDKAARQLTQTVTNLGLSYEATNVADFIAGLEKTYHVADDLLRPAFAKLIQVTGSYTKSKEIMTTALNAAAGAGVDLGTTVQDLGQAYVGNLRGLRKYNLGLTQAELATMSFQEIQDKLNSTFTGQASLAAETYAGKMDALAIASNNAKEIIGRGLVDAISAAFGGGSIDKATTNIEKMAQAVADIVAGLGTMTGWFTKLVKLTDKLTVGNFLQNRQPSAPFDPRTGNMPDMSAAGTRIVMARKKADAEAAKRQKELASLAQKQVKALKDQTALTKAKAILDKSSAVLNMDLIQNTAALMGKVTADETLRLKLQQAILLGNTEQAGNLAQQLLSSQIAAMKLSSSNPLGGFTDALQAALAALQQIRKELELLGAPKVPIPKPLIPSVTPPVIPPLGTDPNNPLGLKSFYGTTGFGQPFLPSIYPTAIPTMPSYVDDFTRRNPATGAMNIVVSIDPSAAQYGIGVASVNNSANGNKNNYSTIQSFAGGLGL
jgi:hypothetical protein